MTVPLGVAIFQKFLHRLLLGFQVDVVLQVGGFFQLVMVEAAGCDPVLPVLADRLINQIAINDTCIGLLFGGASEHVYVCGRFLLFRIVFRFLVAYLLVKVGDRTVLKHGNALFLFFFAYFLVFVFVLLVCFSPCTAIAPIVEIAARSSMQVPISDFLLAFIPTFLVIVATRIVPYVLLIRVICIQRRIVGKFGLIFLILTHIGVVVIGVRGDHGWRVHALSAQTFEVSYRHPFHPFLLQYLFVDGNGWGLCSGFLHVQVRSNIIINDHMICMTAVNIQKYNTKIRKNTTMSQHEDIIDFMNKFTINCVDPHTTIVTQLMPEDRCQPEMSGFDLGPKDASRKMPVCYLVKDMLIEEEGQLNGVLDTLAMHQQLSSKYILTLVHHQVFLKCLVSQNSHPHQQSYQEESCFGDSHHKMQSNTKMNNEESTLNENRKAIRAIYQYGKLTLKEEIGNRIASNTLFEQEELWAIMATIVQALGYLEHEGIVYGVLGTDKIFINDSLVKILDPSATATDPLLITQGRLYSPEILNDEENINMFKSDVYIAGLVILECGLLVDLSKEVEPNLPKYLDEFRQNYSAQLVQLVEMCLEVNFDNRPSFEDLKKYLAKELDMNDFESAYDSNGIRILKPMANDPEDLGNPAVPQIEIEFQECNCDILYESIGQVQIQQHHKEVSEHDRAKMRYLGIYTSGRQSVIQAERTGQDRHRHSSSSPIQTRRNSKKGIKNTEQYPTFNMAISESVYDNQIIPVTNRVHTDKTNRKGQSNQDSNRQDKQNMNMGQQRSLAITNQKIKKTKLIKEKLVKNCQDAHVDHTFGNTKKGMRSNDEAESNRRMCLVQRDNNKYGQSIQEEQDEESESSYLYHNTGSSKMSKREPTSSQISKSSLNMKGSSKGSSRYQNSNSRTESVQDQLFTDPNLMQTIKEDLARISTTKNIQSYGSQNRWFK